MQKLRGTFQIMKKILIVLCTITVFGIGPRQSAADQDKPLRIHFLNVGYADAILMELPNGKNVLIDAGDKNPPRFLERYCLDHGILALDAAVITHPHVNHFGGYFRLLKTIKIHEVWINGTAEHDKEFPVLMKIFNRLNIPVHIKNAASPTIDLAPGVSLHCLHPGELWDSINDDGMVLWLKYRNTSFLFTADIGFPIQKKLLTEHPELRASSMVQIPHHGGPIYAKWGEAFPRAIFIISTGPNPWGIPYQEELQKLGDRVLRT